MSRLFELCKKGEKGYQCVHVIASWMALAGVVTACCIPGTESQRVSVGKGHGKGKRAASILAEVGSVDISEDTSYVRARKPFTAGALAWIAAPNSSGKLSRQGSPRPQVRGAGTFGWGPIGSSLPAGRTLPQSLAGRLGNDDSTPKVTSTTAT